MPSSSRSREDIARVRPGLERILHEKGLKWGSPIFIRIFKEPKALEVWLDSGKEFRHFRTYPICAYGGAGLGPKEEEGDGKAPEGFYFVIPSRLNPTSQFHLAMNVGYPNAYDRAWGRTGSAIMIHGSCVSIGCFAMTDSGIEEIYALADAALRNGQPFFRVHIFPFPMTDENMKQKGGSQWENFWDNLKAGHDFFENTGRPPDVTVRNGRYLFR